jgi:hypothetical protein
MEIIFIAFVSFALRLGISAINSRKPAITTVFRDDRTSLCRNCVYAHIARSFDRRKELVACTYAGVMRPMKFAVSDCTMFFSRDSNVEVVRITGFAGTLHSPEAPAIAATLHD